MNFQYIALISFAMVAACCGHIGGQVPRMYQDTSPQVYCGRSLARSLALLCYDESMNEKRSEIGTMYINPTHGVMAKGGVTLSCGIPCFFYSTAFDYLVCAYSNATL